MGYGIGYWRRLCHMRASCARAAAACPFKGVPPPIVLLLLLGVLLLVVLEVLLLVVELGGVPLELTLKSSS